MLARSTSPSWARVRQASPSRESIDWALAADSISPRSTSACAVRRFSDRRVQASARATASFGAVLRSRCGAAAAAGSTVSTPTTSPSRIRGWPWAERMPRSRISRSAARRPVAWACTGCRSRMTRARKGEWLSATGARASGGGARPPPCRRRLSGTGRPSPWRSRAPTRRRGWRRPMHAAGSAESRARPGRRRATPPARRWRRAPRSAVLLTRIRHRQPDPLLELHASAPPSGGAGFRPARTRRATARGGAAY